MTTETYRERPITVSQLESLLAEFGSQFSDPQRLRESWDGLKKWCLTKNLPVTPTGARGWFERDLERDQVLSFRFPRASADPLAEAHPSTFEPSETTIREAIARGDLHNFLDNPDLSIDQHAAICPRCQIGERSRRVVDERAAALGKPPFPGFGNLLKQFEDRVQRCDDCGELEDVVAPDRCGKAFWHLPDIYLALHSDRTLEDLGQFGPFMRSFLRHQRPGVCE
jgi:hypothetical protein